MRLPKVLRPLSRLIAALQGVRDGLRAISSRLEELSAVVNAQGPDIERLEVLEKSRHQFEAMCEGLLLKAEGKHRAANNAEARERQMKKSYEHLIDPFPEAGVEPEAPGRHPDIIDDATPSEAERVHALRLDVAPNNKALAQRAKFGVR